MNRPPLLQQRRRRQDATTWRRLAPLRVALQTTDKAVRPNRDGSRDRVFRLLFCLYCAFSWLSLTAGLPMSRASEAIAGKQPDTTPGLSEERTLSLSHSYAIYPVKGVKPMGIDNPTGEPVRITVAALHPVEPKGSLKPYGPEASQTLTAQLAFFETLPFYAVGNEDWSRRLADKFAKETSVQTLVHSVCSNDCTVDLAAAIKQLASRKSGSHPGLFIVQAQAGDQRAYALIQTTNLAAVVTQSDQDTLVWVTDNQTDRPVDGAEVFVYPQPALTPDVTSQARIQHSIKLRTAGTTNENGVLVFSRPCSAERLSIEEDRLLYAGPRQNRVLTITHAGDVLLLSEEDRRPVHGAYCLPKPEIHTPCEKVWASLTTPRRAYRAGETVSIIGWIDRSGPLPATGYRYALSLRTPKQTRPAKIEKISSNHIGSEASPVGLQPTTSPRPQYPTPARCTCAPKSTGCVRAGGITSSGI